MKKNNIGLEFEVTGERLPSIEINRNLIAQKMSTLDANKGTSRAGRATTNAIGRMPLSQPTS